MRNRILHPNQDRWATRLQRFALPALLLTLLLGASACDLIEPIVDGIDDDKDDRDEMAVLATSNPGGLDNDAIVRLSTDLDKIKGTFKGFEGIASIQSVALDMDGTGYLTFDATMEMTGGVLVIDDLAMMMEHGMIGDGDRMIAGPMTGLVAPKGIIVVDKLGLIMVADFGAGNIKAFEKGAQGDVAPVFVIDDVGAGSVWDVVYDANFDRLFASGTAGDVLVYDNVSKNMGAAGPDRVITPVKPNGNAVSTNLHGIDYAPEHDALIVSDVGDAASPSDGQLYTLFGASTADGMVAYKVRIAGSNTKLGNPVDVAYDAHSGSVYVAEKSNDVVLRYDDILTQMDDLNNVAADASVAVVKAESVALVMDDDKDDKDKY